MTGSTGNAPAWLFAFVDLAFLLLLGMTQIAGNPNAPELGEVLLPRIGGEVPSDLPGTARELHQLRVHRPDDEGSAPFELRGGDGDGLRLSAAELEPRLVALGATGAARPLLAPHADSRSQDLLDAVGLLETVWPSRRRATVERVLH